MSGSRSTFSTLLNELMQAHNVSLDQLAHASGVSRSTIYRWRDGRVARVHSLAHLLRVASALELDRITTSRLLQAAGQPALDRLEQAAAEPALQQLLQQWQPPRRNRTLPAELTSFVGRETELLAIAGLVRRADARLITLTGTGGSGKTRLARRVAHELQDAYDGVLYVPLDNLDDPAQLLPAIAQRAGLRQSAGVGVAERLGGYFESRAMLLVLDNMEHLVDAGREIVLLLEAAPELTVLVTSRIPLQLTGEHVYPIAPFGVPPPGAGAEELRANPAITLFIARALAANATLNVQPHELQVVRDICAVLEGLPLALELAAARCGQFAIPELLERYPSALALAGNGPRDAADRQRTLRNALAWTWELLEPGERRLLNRLAIFSGPWSARAVAEICRQSDDETERDVVRGLAQLVDHSLVQRREEADQYAMLSTIREYAAEQLGQGDEWRVLRARHARYFLQLASARDGHYVPGLRRSLDLLQIERAYADIRAALDWAHGHDRAMLVQFAALLWPYWHEYGLFREGRDWLAAALAGGLAGSARLEAELQTGELLLAYSEADYQPARQAGERARALWSDLEDTYGMAVTLLYLGQLNFVTGEIDAAGRSLAQSLIAWRAFGLPVGVARCLTELSVLLATTGQTEQALQSLREAQLNYEREGLREGVARSLNDQGLALLMAQRPDLALPYLEQALEIARELGSGPLLSYGLFYFGTALVFAGQLGAARTPLDESLRMRFEARDRYGVAYTLLGLAALARRREHYERAARLAGAASSLLEHAGIVMNPGMQHIYASEMEAVRENLGAGAEAAFEAGRQLRFDHAVQEALEG